MARNRDPFTQALSSLRERIQSGALPGGSPIIVQDEAQRLRLSTTPVREALARLSGEGLVERAALGGYLTLSLDAAAIRDLYEMQSECLRFANRLNRKALDGVSPPSPMLEGLPGPAIRQLFTNLIFSAGNRMLCEAYDKVSIRLERLRRLEPLVFTDLATEASALYAAYHRDLEGDFAEAIDRYHARRMSAAGVLARLSFDRDTLAPMDLASTDTPNGPAP